VRFLTNFFKKKVIGHTTMVKVTVKWGKEKFDDVELDTSDSVTAFKGIPVDDTPLARPKGFAWSLVASVGRCLFGPGSFVGAPSPADPLIR
jgi:hypothetical protein